MNAPTLPATPPRIVIVGAGYAGLLCALRLAGRCRARVTLVSASEQFTERTRLHERVARGASVSRPLAAMLGARPVERVTARVARIDLRAQRLDLDDGPAIAWDHLVLATGSVDDAPETFRAHTHGVGTPESAARAALALAATSARRVSVVGGGLTAVELATELAEAQPERAVTLVCAGDLLPGMSAQARDYARATLSALGVTLREGRRVLAADAGALALDDGATIPHDVALRCTGFRATSLARESGLACDDGDRLRVDETLRATSHPEVWGAGDAAVMGSLPLRMACATAMPLGAYAADAIRARLRGDAPRPLRFGYLMQCVSLGRRRGLVQRVDATDAPVRAVLRGSLGARVKESVLRYTTRAMTLERWLPGTYTWPRGAP
jgi:NADH dehydrogenase FAD-containing subunit